MAQLKLLEMAAWVVEQKALGLSQQMLALRLALVGLVEMGLVLLLLLEGMAVLGS